MNSFPQTHLVNSYLSCEFSSNMTSLGKLALTFLGYFQLHILTVIATVEGGPPGSQQTQICALALPFGLATLHHTTLPPFKYKDFCFCS